MLMQKQWQEDRQDEKQEVAYKARQVESSGKWEVQVGKYKARQVEGKMGKKKSRKK